MLKTSGDRAGLVADIAAIAVIACTTVVVGGWMLNIPIMRSFAPHWTPMAPLGGLLLATLAGAVLCFHRSPAAARALLLVAFLGAAVVLAEYLLGMDVGIQGISNMLAGGDAPIPENPAPDTATAILLLALALTLVRSRHTALHDLADVIAFIITIICLQVLVAYSYNIAHFSSFTGFRQIAPHSTIAIMVLALATISFRPSHGVFSALAGRTHSAALLRQLIPITVLLCIVVGWLQVLAIREGVARTMPELIAWTITGTVAVLALLLFVTSGEIRRAEAATRQRQHELEAAMIAAEAASETKSRFMAVMSHELRTPLTAVIGYADLLDAGVAGPLPHEAKNYLDRIGGSSRELIGLIDAVLFYAGGKRQTDNTATTRVDVAALVTDVVGTYNGRSGGIRNTELIVPPDPLYVVTDPDKVRQIVMHLLSNAHKFAGAGAVGVRLRSNAIEAVIEVWDTGIGIADVDMTSMWEPFHLVDGSHTRAYGGVGLGLTLAHQLTGQIGARIHAESTPGEGSTFSLVMPMPALHAAPDAGIDGVRVLIVDDEASVLRLMARTLARHGAETIEAASGAAALDLVARSEVDVVVTDISMPGMNGIELAEELRRSAPRLPVMFVSGAELDARDRARIDALGSQLLRKPFDLNQLVDGVAALRR